MTSREEMLQNIQKYAVSVDIDAVFSDETTSANFRNDTLAIGSVTGLEVLLPKYNISTGRDGDAEAISQARIYLDKSEEWFKEDIKIGEVNPDGKAFIGFLLSAVQENRSEKVQTTPLNGDNYSTTFYGESPSIYSFQGILYNTHYARWRELFTILYDKAFRGSQIAKHRQLLHIVYDNKIISGWMLNLSQSLNAGTDTMADFNFQFLVRTETILATETELQYNNAYFTGQRVTTGLDTLASIPESDDYLNVARIKPPPKLQKGPGGKAKRYACRPGKEVTYKDGKKRKADPRFKGQHIRNGSPVSTSCDVAEAALNAIRARDNAVSAAQTKFDRSKKTQADREVMIAEKTAAETQLRRELKQTYKDVSNNAEGIKNPSAQRRARELLEELPTLESAVSASPDKISSVAQKIAGITLKYEELHTAKQ
mgnify:CR=1 FL=1